MKTESADNKTHFVRIIEEILHSISSDTDRAREYLTSEGLDPDKIKREGLKRIKNIEFRLIAQKTKANEKNKRLRAAVKKKKNRIQNGVCPCCTRTFVNLQRHMATKHNGCKSVKGYKVKKTKLP